MSLSTGSREKACGLTFAFSVFQQEASTAIQRTRETAEQSRESHVEVLTIHPIIYLRTVCLTPSLISSISLFLCALGGGVGGYQEYSSDLSPVFSVTGDGGSGIVTPELHSQLSPQSAQLTALSDPDGEDFFEYSDGEDGDGDQTEEIASEDEVPDVQDEEWPPYFSPTRSSVLSSRVGQYAEPEIVESPAHQKMSQLPIFSVQEESEEDLQQTPGLQQVEQEAED